MANSLYDDPFKQLIATEAAGMSVGGTDASDTELLRVPVSRDIKAEGTGYVSLKIGGTADSRNIVIGKSAAGTGAVSAIGTATIGTAADGTNISFTLTQTDFAVGDSLVITEAAGTSALVASVYSVVLPYREDFD